MKPVLFPQVTRILQRPEEMTEEECGALPVFSDGRQCISCWQMSWKERLSALFFGRIWLYVISGVTQPPVGLEITRTIFGKPKRQA